MFLYHSEVSIVLRDSEKLDTLLENGEGDVAGHKIRKEKSKCSNLLFIIVAIVASKPQIKQLAVS